MKLYSEKVRKYYKYIYEEESFAFAQNGSFSSSGCQSASRTDTQIYGGANAYEVGQNHWFSITYTYINTIPASTYKFAISISGQGNGYIWTPTVTVTYDDSTTEQVYTTGGGNSLSDTFTFVASKPIKSISATGEMTHSSSQYVWVFLYLTSQTHLVQYSEESTSSDYDYYKDVDIFSAIKQQDSYYGVN